jgi:hypothetical protein
MSFQIAPITDFKEMAKSLAPLFGLKENDFFALMLIADADGIHPARANLEYDIVKGKPAIKSQAALSRFQNAGGVIQWIKRDDSGATLKLSHKSAGELVVSWDESRARKAGVYDTNPNYKKYPAAMYSARCIAEGVRALLPSCLSGLYLGEEVQDFGPKAEPQPAEYQIVNDPPKQVIQEAPKDKRSQAIELYHKATGGDAEKMQVVNQKIADLIGKQLNEAGDQDFDLIIDFLTNY